jgi:hypothetical protein
MDAATNYLGRCKECDYALFASASQITPAESFKDVRAGEAPKRVGNNGVWGRCSNRHKVFILRAVKGTYSDVHQCDSRCLNAKGHECTCSCGGANHGRGYAVEIHAAPEPTAQPAVKMITEPQAKFLRTLLDERSIPAKGDQTGEDRRAAASRLLDERAFTCQQASKTIEWLLTLDRKLTGISA